MNVVDISPGLAGRACAQLLAYLGHGVVRVDLAGDSCPDSFAAELLDVGKSRIALALRQPADLHDFLELVASASAIIDDGGPMHLGRHGLDESLLRSRQPQLVLTVISDFGLDGPLAMWKGSELVNLAAGGLLFLTGRWDQPPVQLAPYQAQLTAGLLAAVATAAALYAGGPVTIDLSKQEAVMAMVTPSLTNYIYTGVIDAREGKVDGMSRIERAADRWVYAGPASPATADYTAFAAFLGIPELAEPRFATAEARMEHWDEHQALIVPRLRERTAQEWVDDAADWRFTFAHVQSTLDLLTCPVLNDRRFFVTIDTNHGRVKIPAAPYLLDGQRPRILDAATPTNTTSDHN